MPNEPRETEMVIQAGDDDSTPELQTSGAVADEDPPADEGPAADEEAAPDEGGAAEAIREGNEHH